MQEIWVLAAGDVKSGPWTVNKLTETREELRSFLAGNLDIFSPASLRQHFMERAASSQKWQMPHHYLGPGWEYKCFWVQTHSRSTRMQSSPWQIRTSTGVSSKLACDLIPAAHTDHPRAIITFNIFQAGTGPCWPRKRLTRTHPKWAAQFPAAALA